MRLTLWKVRKMMKAQNGNLNLAGMPITRLPKRLTVNGDLDLVDCEWRP